MMKSDSFSAWFVASVDATEKREKRHRTRTWCFFLTEQEAVDYIRARVYLLSEGRYYSHAIIEQWRDGDIYFADSERWFKLEPGKHLRLGDRGPDYVEPEDRCFECEKPEIYRGVANFCLC